MNDLTEWERERERGEETTKRKTEGGRKGDKRVGSEWSKEKHNGVT